MYRQEQTGISQGDTAVKLNHVTKTFEQWQRPEAGKGLLKHLWKPEKKTVTALDDVSFTLQRGEFVAYAGPNGAGKSTTMKLLSGMLLPGKGGVSVLGLSPQKQRIELMRRLGVLFGNRTELWWDHPVIQSFAWKRVVWDIPKERYEKMLSLVTELLDLSPILHTFARELSLGQRMRAALAMMLLHEPEVILLDEPTLGLDVLAKRQMIDFLKYLNSECGTTILVTSHDMDDLEEMTKRILLVSKGKLAFDGGFETLREETGSLCRIRLTTKEGTVPTLTGAKLISRNGRLLEFEADTAKTPMQRLLAELSAGGNVTDLEITKAPIEQVIAGLYTEWKSAGKQVG